MSAQVASLVDKEGGRSADTRWFAERLGSRVSYVLLSSHLLVRKNWAEGTALRSGARQNSYRSTREEHCEKPNRGNELVLRLWVATRRGPTHHD